MKAQLEIILALISLVTFLSGAFAWYSSAIRKQYAAERDFIQLNRNQELIRDSLEEILKDLGRNHDESQREVLELKALINVLMVRLTGDTVSEVLSKRKSSQ